MINWDMMITPESLQVAAARDEARVYLAATDWYVIRAVEPDGKPIPDEVVEKRRAARAVLNG